MIKLQTSPCKGCGKPIVWGKTEEGKSIPLDAVAPVYEVSFNGPHEPYFAQRKPECRVSHFATCAKANQFSGKGKQRTMGVQAEADDANREMGLPEGEDWGDK